MSSKWRKAKLALGRSLCAAVPPETDDLSEKSSDAGSLSPASWTFGTARLSKSYSKSSKETCSICLATMKNGDGNAVFTAECSHSFHFQCITSNVKHGNLVCPVCRAKWKELPIQGPNLEPPSGRSRINPVEWSNNDRIMRVVRQFPPRPISNRNVTQLFQSPEPAVFNDDESLDHQTRKVEVVTTVKSPVDMESNKTITVKTYPEVPAVPQSNAFDNFTVLINVKAPASFASHSHIINQSNSSSVSQTPRAPVDLVTVLDISGSMAGTKIALLKRAMGFVIQNLGPNDRLAVIAFSSTARRLFPLRRMSETGRQQALQAVNSLVANGGTNIAEGLRKSAKVMEDRKEKNPVGSIILLSDGQDTYTVNTSGGGQNEPNYELLLPMSIHARESTGFKIPVHTFGFGMDHDASLLHSISEASGGTFSFIETEGVIQDAFAQCIGGLLSVVVKNLFVTIDSVHSEIRFGSIKSGSYPNHLGHGGKNGYVDVGDMYADEERDFLVSVKVPKEVSSKETSLLKVISVYTNPLTNQTVKLHSEEVSIQRPERVGRQMVSLEVDRQRNRLQAAEAIAESRAAAEQGNLAGAISILESCRKLLSQSVSAKARDRLCIALDAELKEMQERMASRNVYEASGRAYMLSGMSSHSWQRATARGDSTDSSSLLQSYQTQSMTEMLTRSQAALVCSPSAPRLLRPKPR